MNVKTVVPRCALVQAVRVPRRGEVSLDAEREIAAWLNCFDELSWELDDDTGNWAIWGPHGQGPFIAVHGDWIVVTPGAQIASTHDELDFRRLYCEVP